MSPISAHYMQSALKDQHAKISACAPRDTSVMVPVSEQPHAPSARPTSTARAATRTSPSHARSTPSLPSAPNPSLSALASRATAALTAQFARSAVKTLTAPQAQSPTAPKTLPPRKVGPSISMSNTSSSLMTLRTLSGPRTGRVPTAQFNVSPISL
jgi:hypothetical protein